MSFINELDSIIAKRKETPSEKSYTTSLFEGGLDRILRKVGEEAGEVIIAAKNQDKIELANEVSDLTYHLLVALHASGMSWSDVEDVLRERHQK
jgi:phosphoribosyl-ATP pyrophosphohydrolase